MQRPKKYRHGLARRTESRQIQVACRPVREEPAETPKPTRSLPTVPTTFAPPKPKWVAAYEYVVKGFPMEPKNPGDKPRFVRFKVPVVVVEVMDVNGPDNSGIIKLSRSANTLTVTFRGGNKASYTPTKGREWMTAFFGHTMAETLGSTLRV